MCGILYVHRKDGLSAVRSIMKRYHKQKNRGQQGFGYIAIKDGYVVNYERAMFEHEIFEKLKKETAEEILFHHRFPTSTPNIEEAAHPLYIGAEVLDHGYYIVHNGVIRNDEELKKKHEEAGIAYRTVLEKKIVTREGKSYTLQAVWNDSEALAVESALVLDGKKKEIDATGPAAVICIQVDPRSAKVLNRFFYRNRANPLVYKNDNNLVTLTSEGPGEDAEPMAVYILNLDGTITEDPRKILAPLSYTTYTATNHYNDEESGVSYHHHVHHAGDTSPTHQLPLGRPTTDVPARGAGFTENRGGDDIDGYTLFSDGVSKIIQIGELFKTMDKAFIEYLTDDRLWAEFDKAIGLVEAIEEALTSLGNSSEEYGMVDEGVIEMQVDLETQLGKARAYQDAVEKVITNRGGATEETRVIHRNETSALA